MADAKLSALTAATAATTDDLLYIVDAPGTTPVSKRITFDNLQKSISVVGAAAGVTTQGDVGIPSANAIYLGDAATNGSWRIVISGTTLSIQRREGGSYIEKGAFEA